MHMRALACVRYRMVARMLVSLIRDREHRLLASRPNHFPPGNLQKIRVSCRCPLCKSVSILIHERVFSCVHACVRPLISRFLRGNYPRVHKGTWADKQPSVVLTQKASRSVPVSASNSFCSDVFSQLSFSPAMPKDSCDTGSVLEGTRSTWTHDIARIGRFQH